MNIDEAIKHCREKSAELMEEAEDCRECAYEHLQLAEWLEELKARREAMNDDEFDSSILADSIERRWGR